MTSQSNEYTIRFESVGPQDPQTRSEFEYLHIGWGLVASRNCYTNCDNNPPDIQRSNFNGKFL